MNYAAMRDRVQAGLEAAAPTWTPEGPLRSVPGLGPYFAKRFSQANFPEGPVATPAAVATRVNHWLNGMTRNRRQSGLARIIGAACQNRRANTCSKDYFVRDVNPGCFLGLAAMLSVLWRHLPHAQAVSRNTIDAMAENAISWRREKTANNFFPAAQCSCKTTQASCRHPCVWSGGVCTPEARNISGFEGVAGYAGQRVPPVIPRRPGSKYTVSPVSRVEWRRPGTLEKIRAWEGTRWP